MMGGSRLHPMSLSTSSNGQWTVHLLLFLAESIIIHFTKPSDWVGEEGDPMPDLVQDPFVISAAAFTDPGQARKHNEDFVAYHVPTQPPVRDSHGALFIVCDGVAGGAAGEIASEHAVRRILNDYYQAAADQDPQARLLTAVQRANADIYSQNTSQPDTRPMTTTVVAAVLLGPHWLLAHAGDSRAYLVRGGQISQVTQDHSWVAEMVRSGDLTPAEAEAHPWRNRITRALGIRENVELDTQTLDAQPGDRLVLCSDGLTRHVSAPEILDSVTRQPANAAGQQLVGLANQRGGLDNISVLVVELVSPTEVRGRSAPPAEKARAPAPPRRPRALWPLAVAVGLLLLLIATLIFAGGPLLRRQQKTATPAAAEAAPALAPTATSSPLPTLLDTPAPTPTAPAPSATLRSTQPASATPTRTGTPIPTPIPTHSATAPASAPPVIVPPTSTATRLLPSLTLTPLTTPIALPTTGVSTPTRLTPTQGTAAALPAPSATATPLTTVAPPATATPLTTVAPPATATPLTTVAPPATATPLTAVAPPATATPLTTVAPPATATPRSAIVPRP
jgi:protein phosphatase